MYDLFGSGVGHIPFLLPTAFVSKQGAFISSKLVFEW
jgi:hypothetical protein